MVKPEEPEFSKYDARLQEKSRHTSEIRDQEALSSLNTFSISELLGGKLQQIDLSYYKHRGNEIPEAYARLGENRFRVAFIDHEDGSREFILVGTPLMGTEINQLMYFAAPDRNVFGLDTRDITGDWQTLYKDVEEEKKRLARHARIPGWSIFEAERKYLLSLLLEQNKGGFGQAIPLIRWKQTSSGNREWIFSHDQLPQELSQGVDKESPFSPLLGLIYLHAYSPDITEQLPTRMGHNPVNSFKSGAGGDDGRSQTMGSTQVPPLLVFSVQPEWDNHFPSVRTIFDSTLVHQVEAYAQTGQVPDVDFKPFTDPNTLPKRDAQGSGKKSSGFLTAHVIANFPNKNEYGSGNITPQAQIDDLPGLYQYNQFSGESGDSEHYLENNQPDTEDSIFIKDPDGLYSALVLGPQETVILESYPLDPISDNPLFDDDLAQAGEPKWGIFKTVYEWLQAAYWSQGLEVSEIEPKILDELLETCQWVTFLTIVGDHLPVPVVLYLQKYLENKKDD